MPSFCDQGPTIALQAITASSLAANTLKSIIENPLAFEKAALSINLGLNGRYIPLNKPFNLENGSVNGFRNGVTTDRAPSSIVDTSKGGNGYENGLSVNGDQSVSQMEGNVSTEWPQILPRPPGLKNFSNTCYMNSTLQALMHVPPLVSYLLKGNHGSICIISASSALIS